MNRGLEGITIRLDAMFSCFDKLQPTLFPALNLVTEYFIHYNNTDIVLENTAFVVQLFW